MEPSYEIATATLHKFKFFYVKHLALPWLKSFILLSSHSLTFPSVRALHSITSCVTSESPAMPYCDRCSRTFSTWEALNQHKEDSSKHYMCDDCEKDFSSWNGLKQHYANSRKHHYCSDCNKLFGSKKSLKQHLDDVHWYCSVHRLVRNALRSKTNRGLLHLVL